MTGIFGSLDLDQIPEDPFWVAKGEYRALITNAFYSYNDGKDEHQLVIAYTIQSEGDFFNSPVREWFRYYDNPTEEWMDSLPSSEKAQVIKDLSAIRQRLCGNKRRGTKGLGIDPSELGDFKPEDLINIEVDIAVINRGNDNEFTNVKWVELVTA
jgi:hypothetical protein